MDELLNAALVSLGYPVRKLVYITKGKEGAPDTYFTFQLILSQPTGHADDEDTMTKHIFSVHLFTKKSYVKLLKDTLTVLKQNGFTISSIDGEIYENDTGYYHVPITINILEEG